VIRVSASKIKTFLYCLNKFYYHYIDKQPDKVGIGAVIGTCVHAAVDHYFKFGRPALETFTNLWHQELKRNGLEHKHKAFFDGEDMLVDFNWSYTPTETEKYFYLPFPDRVHPIANMEGYIDQVFISDGVEPNKIVDIKTSQYRPTQEQIDNDPQFIIYNWAFKQMYGEDVEIYWYHARTGEYILADVNSPDKLDPIIEVVKDIDQFMKAPEPPETTVTCRWCPHRNLCLSPRTEALVASSDIVDTSDIRREMIE